MAYFYSESDFKKLDNLKSSKLGVAIKSGDTAMSETSRSVVIGLGGMGLATVTRLKRALRERVGNIDETKIRFLAIDTSKDDINLQRNDDLFKPEELPLFDNASVTQMLKQEPQYRPNAVNAMIPSDFCPELSGDGANQIRMAGRLSLMEIGMFQSIISSISNAISELADFTNKTLDIHIVAGTGGGTGSGLCVDIPFVVRKIAKDLGISDTRVRVMGHVFLPNVYDKGGTSNLDCAYRNGYAALKEIDYLMNIEQIGETFEAEYPLPFGKCSFAKNIFDQCTLIGGQSAANIIAENPKTTAVAACVDNLINQVTRVVSSDDNVQDASISDFFTSNAFYTNVGAALNATLLDPSINFPMSGKYKYQIIGSSSIKFPNDHIVEGFVGAVFGRANDILRQNADRLTKEEVDAFEKNIASPTFIIDKISEAVANEIRVYLDGDQHTWNKETVTASTFDAALQGIVTKSISNFDKDRKLIPGAVAAANKKAAAIFIDPAKGPYFLGKLLKSYSNDGAAVNGYYQRLDGYSLALESYSENIRNSVRQFENQRAEIRENMTKGLFGGNVKRYLDDYKAVLTNLYVAKFRVSLCELLTQNYYLGEGINGIVYKIKSSLNEYYLSLIDLFEKIGDITIKNAQDAKGTLNPPEGILPPQGSIFALTDPIFQPLKAAVSSTIEEELRRLGDNGVNAFIGDLAREMVEKHDTWQISTEKTACVEKFREFINGYKAFDNVTKRSMADYLDQAYGLEPQNKKAQVVTALVHHVNALAEPMCNVWESISWPQLEKLCYRYLVIPSAFAANKDTVWGPLFESAFKGQDTSGNKMARNIFRSSDNNAIYSYTMYACMPMWIHGTIVKYEKDYFTFKEPGLHINENESVTPQMKRFPALMVPSQWFRAKEGVIEYKNDNELAIYEELKNAFVYAKEHGIVTKNSAGEYAIYYSADKPDTTDLDVFVQNFVQDPENKKNDVVDSSLLYSRYAEKFGAKQMQIVSVKSVRPVDDDTSVDLIRNQMKLADKLLEEVAFFKKNLIGNKELERILATETLKPQIRELAKYMLYGIIAPNEIGVWTYTLGENVFTITNKAMVNNSDKPWQVKYMEMAVCTAFRNMEKYAAHQPLMEKKVNAVNDSIYAGSMDVFKELKQKYTDLKAKAETNVNAIEMKRNSGDILTQAETEIEWFYNYLISSLDDFIGVFSA